MARRQKSYPVDALFRVLADRTRLRLLNLIADKEICVCYFVEILKMSQPKISRHLAYLRRAGIVAARRQGRWMHYRLVEPGDAVAAAILKETLTHVKQLPEMRADLAKLESRCCGGEAGLRLELAPTPLVVSKTPAVAEM